MCELSFDGDLGFMAEEERTARKAHTCACCGSTISPGKRYTVLSYKYEGDVGSEKCCAPCNRVRHTFGKEHNGYPFPSSLTEYMDECVVDREPGYRRWSAMLSRIRKRRNQARAVSP